MSGLYNCFIVMAGGALGSLLRYGAVCLSFRYAPLCTFPWHTLLVNLLGSFIIGLLWGGFSLSGSESSKLFWMIGLLGGFTTFSSFSLETIRMIDSGQKYTAGLYILACVIGGLMLAYAGFMLTKKG